MTNSKKTVRTIEQWTGQMVRVEREGGTVIIHVKINGQQSTSIVPLAHAREMALILADAVAFDAPVKEDIIPYEHVANPTDDRGFASER
jgi:hypothetical protein